MLGYAYTRTRTDKTAYQMDFMSSYEGILYFQDSFKYFRTCTTLFNTFEGTFEDRYFGIRYCTCTRTVRVPYESTSYFRTSVRTRTTMIND
jgi:hypothetical protein